MRALPIDVLMLVDTLIFLSLSNELVKASLSIGFQHSFVDQLSVVLGPVDQVALFRLIFRWPSFVVVQKVHILLPHHDPPLVLRHHISFVLSNNKFQSKTVENHAKARESHQCGGPHRRDLKVDAKQA